jgi:alpha-galactosidase
MVIDRLVNECGFRCLKLDFLYGASLPGDGYNPLLSPSERLASGLDLIREAAGKNTILLGCGCPLAPAIGRVDSMRIGPDVAPYWLATYRYHLARDPHAACTRFAIRNILARGAMHRRLWFNDPDCVMLRETSTRLSRDERMSLVNAVIVSGGMPVISDDLSLYDPATWALAARIFELSRACDGGEAWTLDLLEREFPAYCYNTAGYLALFNMGDTPEIRTLNISERLDGLVAVDAGLENVWTGERFHLSSGVLDARVLKPRASMLFRII